MKKSIQLIVLSALFITAYGNAQTKIIGNGKITTEKRTTAGYDKIEVSGFFDVVLVSGTEGTITIEGEENILPHIKVETKENVLKISTEKNTNLNTKKGVVVTVPFEQISALYCSGSGNITSKKTISNPTFTAKLSGSGNLTITVKNSDFEFNLSGSGNVALTGNSDNFVSKTSGSGNMDGLNLTTKKANIAISGSGNVKVNCSENLYARVSGSGNIHYKGDPQIKDTKVSGSGEISKI